MVSVVRESQGEFSGYLFLWNISDNIHTFTLTWFLFGVNQKGSCQVAFLSETFLTIWFTLIWFLFYVNTNVHCHVALLCETFLTNPFMYGFRIWSRESLVTVCTLEWFLFGVNPFMYVFRTWLRETLVTVYTLVWFLLSLNIFMPGFRTWSRETLVTVCTLECEPFHVWI